MYKETMEWMQNFGMWGIFLKSPDEMTGQYGISLCRNTSKSWQKENNYNWIRGNRL